jgi:hypothetical protein
METAFMYSNGLQAVVNISDSTSPNYTDDNSNKMNYPGANSRPIHDAHYGRDSSIGGSAKVPDRLCRISKHFGAEVTVSLINRGRQHAVFARATELTLLSELVGILMFPIVVPR